jgi:hypothetical protein
VWDAVGWFLAGLVLGAIGLYGVLRNLVVNPVHPCSCGIGPEVECKLGRIITMLEESETREKQMALDLSALESEVSENTAVIGSAVALLAGLKVRIEELIAGMVTEEDKAKLQAFASELDAASNSLAAAVAENTPSA